MSHLYSFYPLDFKKSMINGIFITPYVRNTIKNYFLHVDLEFENIWVQKELRGKLEIFQSML